MDGPGGGTDAWLDGEPPPRRVTAGDWSLNLRGVSVEDITYRGVPVLSALRVVVRDHDWRTVPATSSSVDVVHEVVRDSETGDGASGEATAERLQVHLSADHDDLGAGVHWSAELVGGGPRLRLAVSGRVTRPFRRNRIGLVVLHPAEVAGAALRVRHPDGSSTTTSFPEQIAPHQPALDVAGLDWTSEHGDTALRLSLDFAGEVFEMEDQRNWTDASFKTYSTPLSAPFPAAVGEGDGFTHVVDITVTEVGPRRSGVRRFDPRALRADEPHHAVRDQPARVPVRRIPTLPSGRLAPRVQLQASTAPGEPTDTASWWRGPLLVELDATGRAWPGVLARARREAGGAGLDVRMTADDPAQVDAVVAALVEGPDEGTGTGSGSGSGAVERVAVYDANQHITTPALWQRLRDCASGLPLVGGTRAHFTELNRRHTGLPADLPALTFSSTPQMHDTSREQVLRAIAVQRLTAEQAVRIAGSRPVHVGPVTLRPRFNAVATSPRVSADVDVVAEGVGAQHVWAADDPRQASRAFAAWLVASYQAFAVAGVASVTLTETWGPRGLTTAEGSPYPAAETVRWLSALDGWELLQTPLVPGLGLVVARRGERQVIVASDLSGSGQQLTVAGQELAVRPWAVLRHDSPVDGLTDAPAVEPADGRSQPVAAPSVRG
ncbi:hypothetical protein FHR75_004137 [Kineococcus radiotolerans]|uniref:Uncharacterized protein n=1 Tax=Kineococcus radiotolerans TaxID=131568 RepID=A0A7W4TQW5_KINRA|nr:hypothetical protein [Kineococcus radiotolerans]MBB2903295.1 hypothetical protein [Kineococcus radiotolerans]